MTSELCERCGAAKATVHVGLTSSDGSTADARFCKACYALAYPVQAKQDATLMAELRRKKFERPMDFDFFRTRFLDRQSQYQAQHLTALADLVAEHLAVTRQSPPEDVRAFLARYASADPAV